MRSPILSKAVLTILYLMLSIAIVHSTVRAEVTAGVAYRTVTVEDVEIFYREAGNPEHPTILLLHGFPTSSHMFRDLIP